METLEINVNDTITTFDTLVQVENCVIELIRKWFNSEDEKPLSITLKKIANKAPPSLEINVNDVLSAKGGLV